MLHKRDEIEREGLVRLFSEAESERPAAPAVSEATPRYEEQAERYIQLLGRIAAQIVAERGALLEALRPVLLQLVFAIAEKILEREVRVDRSIVERTLRQALQNLHFATRIVVYVHPDELAYLREQAQHWAEHVGQIEFRSDAEVERGGCRVESDCGGFEATLRAQLEFLKERLAEGDGP